ncbi:MAG: iron chaperone [Candidatus Aminicenantales bacterium]
MMQVNKKAPTKRGAPAKSVDEYLSRVPAPFRAALEKVRAAYKAAAPKAIEGISWGMPGYKYHGYLGGFAAFKDHCSFFPGSALEAFKDDLKGFETTKGSVHFTPEHPLPAALVKKIVKARVKANESRARA